MKKFRTKYEHRHIGCSFKKVVSMTDQQYLNDCSVDNVLKRYGAIPLPKTPSFGCDCTQFGDMSECMQRVQDGLDKFQELPSAIRQRFGNDPHAFYNWISNPSNVSEAVKLGLMFEKKVESTERELLERIADNFSKCVTPPGAVQSQG